MERGERFYRMHTLLKQGRCVPMRTFLDEFEVSRATFKRDVEYLRDRFRAPIKWDAERRGYVYDLTQDGADRFELPGLWFNDSEVHALLVVHAMLSNLEPGLLGSQVNPLLARLEKILEKGEHPAREIRKRIRLLNVSYRRPQPQHFATAAQGVLKRRRLDIEHYNRERGETVTRQVSPQRLVHYRGTWYLDTWCHLRKDIRSFALDAIHKLALSEDKAQEVDDRKLDEYLASGYGIFGGKATQTAVLRFTPKAARWVSQEQWHEKQLGRLEKDGSYRLELPYGTDTELVMEILRHGADVEVIGPVALRERVAKAHRAAADRYS